MSRVLHIRNPFISGGCGIVNSSDIAAYPPDRYLPGTDRADCRAVIGLYEEFSLVIDPNSCSGEGRTRIKDMHMPAPVDQAFLI